MAIRSCTFTELKNNPKFLELLEAYADETAIAHKVGCLPPVKVNYAMYDKLEAANILHTLVALEKEELVGFMVMYTTESPHYSVQLTVSDALYVSKEHRKTGVGLRLMKEAEKYAISVNSVGLLIGAPIGGPLVDILPHIGYINTNLLFLKRLNA